MTTKMTELEAFDAFHRWADQAEPQKASEELVTASDLRAGDTIQHPKRFWPAQQVTDVESSYGRLTFHLSGGSKIAGIAPTTKFYRQVR